MSGPKPDSKTHTAPPRGESAKNIFRKIHKISCPYTTSFLFVCRLEQFAFVTPYFVPVVLF